MHYMPNSIACEASAGNARTLFEFCSFTSHNSRQVVVGDDGLEPPTYAL